jgi:hypothetical protein
VANALYNPELSVINGKNGNTVEFVFTVPAAGRSVTPYARLNTLAPAGTGIPDMVTVNDCVSLGPT